MFNIGQIFGVFFLSALFLAIFQQLSNSKFLPEKLRQRFRKLVTNTFFLAAVTDYICLICSMWQLGE